MFSVIQNIKCTRSRRQWRFRRATACISDGLLVDFLDIEKRIHDYLDHGNLNDLLPFNPTTENLARWICEQVPHCYRVDVKECEGNEASYETDK